MTETESKWTERVRQWRESGQTASDFSQGKGFEPSTLRFWASQLRHRVPSPDPGAPRMLRVRRMREPPSPEPLVVRVGEACIEVRAGFDAVLLRAVAASLAGKEES
jgi:transposase-like protein